MDGSEHRFLKSTKTVAAGLLLAGVVAVAGCGGGSDNNKSAAPPPVKSAQSSGGVVSAGGTEGLVGPAERATQKGSSGSDKSSNIPANANRKTGALKHGVAAGAACDNGDLMPSADNLPTINAAILCLVNAERADNNLPPLASNPQLQQAAEGMAARMVQEKFFSHETPDGKTVVDRVQPTGYIPDSGDWVVGENLAWGNGALSTPQAIVNGWMNSPGHRANILATDYKDVGLAAAMGSPSTSVDGGTTYVNDFGAKSGADPNTTLPSEDGSSSGSSGGGGDQATAAASAGAGTAVAAKKAKAKRKAKRKHRRKKRH